MKTTFKLMASIALACSMAMPEFLIAQADPVGKATEKVLDQVAQDVSQETSEGDICESPKDVSDLLNEFLESKGWSEGANTSKKGSQFVIQVGIGAIAAPLNHPNYTNSRSLAFDKAMLDAKAKMASYLESVIEVSMRLDYEEPDQTECDKEADLALAQSLREAAPDTIYGKAKLLISKRLDNLLEKEGHDINQAQADRAAYEAAVRERKRLVSSESFSKSIGAFASTAISGMQAFYVVENQTGKNGEIGVIAIWSPALAEMASSLSTGRAVARKKGKKTIKAQLPTSTKVLMSTFGVQQKINEKGELVLIAFAQEAPRTKSSQSRNAARSKAATKARAMIRQFAGEQVATSEKLSEAETAQEFESGAVDYKNESSYKKFQASAAKAMVCNGITQVKSWHAPHPLTKKEVYGVVVAWSPEQATQARRLKKKIESTAKSAARGIRTIEATPTKPATTTKQDVAEEGENLNAGAAGDEDAF